jgi:DNA-binding CsgD family transcriptional regulator
MLTESLDLEWEFGDDLGVARRLRGLALVSMTEGDVAAAAELCVQAIDLLRAHGDDHAYDVVWTLFHLGLTRLAVNDPAGASEHMGEALAVNRGVGSLVATAHCELYLSRAAAKAGDVAATRSHLEASLAAMDEMGGVIAGPDWLWAGAGLAISEGRTRAALRLAGAAEALSHRSGLHVPEQLIVDLGAALDRAREQVGTVKADRLASDGAQRSLDELAVEVLAETEDVDDDPLTRREREIAELVAEGLNNPEIGRRLFISRRTVETHVEHIKQKLGLDTRTQIVAWVLGATVGSDHR